MVNYYGEDGLRQAIDDMNARYARKHALGMASAADHVSVLDIPDNGSDSSSSSNSNTSGPDSDYDYGFVDLQQQQEEQQEEEPMYSEQQLPNPGDRLLEYSNPQVSTSAIFNTVKEDKRGFVYETENDRYDRFNPETGEFSDTNGNENADLIETSFHSSVTGESITKRPNKDVFTWRF
jgi:hypothetical protein